MFEERTYNLNTLDAKDFDFKTWRIVEFIVNFRRQQECSEAVTFTLSGWLIENLASVPLLQLSALTY